MDLLTLCQTDCLWPVQRRPSFERAKRRSGWSYNADCLALPNYVLYRLKSRQSSNKFLYYLLTYLLTPWSRVLFEKLTGFQLSKKFPAFYGTRRFSSALTSARHLSLSWASSIQSITHILLPEDQFNIILPSASGPPEWSLSLRFPHQNPVHPSPFPHTCHMPRPSHSSRFYHPHNIR